MSKDRTYRVEIGSDYRHFRNGKLYKVLNVVKDARTNEAMVVFRAQHGDFQTWVLPVKDFCEFVDKNGYRGPRYMEVKHNGKL